ncbi:MAG: signal recognition particle receptor subunit alpha [Candidatus Aenigmarchaeota archaeon]|nr:signal recognition particle receptor subunit alpha [Candidatus Aenigmarchaeota archaeon]
MFNFLKKSVQGLIKKFGKPAKKKDEVAEDKKIIEEKKDEKVIEKKKITDEKSVPKEKAIEKKEVLCEEAKKSDKEAGEEKVVLEDEKKPVEEPEEVERHEEETKEDKIIPKEEKPKKRGFFSKTISEKDLEKFKLELVKANVSFDVAEKIVEKLKDKEGRNVREILKNELLNLLEQKEFNITEFVKNKINERGNCTVLFFGFNGSGKTTTIARLGNLLLKQKIKVVFAAADTFRAAAIEQISTHGDRLGIDVVKHKYGGDPAAVVFDARKHAETIKGVVLADTAGRLHSDKNLMEELNKVIRINKPDLKILVLDSLTGNDILDQIENFGEMGFDALILTKMDVNEKGGAILSVKQKTDKPILYLGTGQEYEDLEKFDGRKIVEKMLG